MWRGEFNGIDPQAGAPEGRPQRQHPPDRTLDTTQYGGLDGFVQALRTRLPAEATTDSVPFRQGKVFAVNVSGAGLAAPGQSMWFPACVSVAGCAGTNGESISFVRKGATNVFYVRLTAWGLTSPPRLVLDFMTKARILTAFTIP